MEIIEYTDAGLRIEALKLAIESANETDALSTLMVRAETYFEFLNK